MPDCQAAWDGDDKTWVKQVISKKLSSASSGATRGPCSNIRRVVGARVCESASLREN